MMTRKKIHLPQNKGRINMDILSIPRANPSLSPKLKEAREMLKFAAIFFLVAAGIYLLWGVWSIFSGIVLSMIFFDGSYAVWNMFSGVIRIVLGIVAFILKGKLVEDIIMPIDQGRAGDLEDKMVIYIVLGFIFGLFISGLLVLLGYMKVNEATSYRTPQGGYQDSGPQAQQSQPPVQQDQNQTTCPTCGGQTRWVPEQGRYYCDNCQRYV